jgi:hypothetical protein
VALHAERRVPECRYCHHARADGRPGLRYLGVARFWVWELGDAHHYTISKIGCWTALDRAVRLADAGQLPSPHLERWRTERDDIHRWTNQHCWSTTKGAYTFYAGTD